MERQFQSVQFVTAIQLYPLHSSDEGGFVPHTSVGDFGGYLEQIVVPNVSVAFGRHLVGRVVRAALRGLC